MANLKTLVSASFTAGLLSAGMAHAADGNPFQSQSLEKGFMLAEAGTDAKAAPAAGDKKADAKCGADKKMKDGKCGGDKVKEMDKKTDGKCGEGKCGANKAKAK